MIDYPSMGNVRGHVTSLNFVKWLIIPRIRYNVVTSDRYSNSRPTAYQEQARYRALHGAHGDSQSSCLQRQLWRRVGLCWFAISVNWDRRLPWRVQNSRITWAERVHCLLCLLANEVRHTAKLLSVCLPHSPGSKRCTLQLWLPWT